MNNANRDYWLKQSEMLQSSVARMATNSLEVKKLGLTVWAAITGFGFTTTNRYLFILAFVAFILFGIFDIYYPYLERRFRDNFNRLAGILSGYNNSEDQEWIEKMRGNFLKLDNSTNFLEQIPKTIKSWSNLPYLVTLLITILLLFLPFTPPTK